MRSKYLASILGASIVVVSGCSKRAESVTVAEACQKPKDTAVVMEGYLVLPNYMKTTTSYGKRENTKTYQLFLVSRPDAKGESVRTIVTGKAPGGRNGIADLPATGYSFKDLRIFTDEGATVGAGSRLKVTGTVTTAKEDGRCDVVVTKIQASPDTAKGANVQ